MTLIPAADIAKALGMSTRAVYARARREGWQGNTDGKSRRYDVAHLPAEVQRAIIPAMHPEAPAGIEKNREDAIDPGIALTAATAKQREKAQYKLALMAAQRDSGIPVDVFIASYNAGQIQQSVFNHLGKISQATFYRWLSSFEEAGSAGILPQYDKRRSRESSGVLSEVEKGYLRYWYLSIEQHKARYCWFMLRNTLPDSTASYSTVLRYLDSIPRPLLDFYRLGKHKFEEKHQPFIERDPTLYEPMQQAVSDHHCFDFVVSWQGHVFRPWVTAIQDYRSSKIVGWSPAVYPSSFTIAVAFYRMVSSVGAPDLFHCDNGKDYRGRVMNGMNRMIKVFNEHGIPEETLVHVQGAIEMCGVKTTFSKPYHGQSKGRLERTFGTFAEYLSKNSGYYLGSDKTTRPTEADLYWRAVRGKQKQEVCLTWENFVSALDSFIIWYNSSWRGQGKGMDGRTPDEIFFDSSYQRKPRMISPDVLTMAFANAEIRTVGRNGIELDGVTYWAQELFQYAGQKLQVRRPLGNHDFVTISDHKDRYICRAVAGWFGETGDLAADNERVAAARRDNLRALESMDPGRIEPPLGSRSALEIAMKNTPRALPKAVGDEGIKEAPEAPRKSKLISPLDVGLNREE